MGKDNMKRFVIYSAIIGQYDNPLQPAVVDDRFEYVLFSNYLPEGKMGVWQIKRVDYINPIQTKIARYVKTHPESLLPQFEASLWLDANIRIKNQCVYDRFVELVEKKVTVASVKHVLCDCVYEELFNVLDFHYEREKTVVDWGHLLRNRDYPKHNGIIETGMLFRMHTRDDVKEMDALWWKYIENYSRRDQLSFPLVLKECGMRCEYFLPEGKTVRDFEGTELVKHRNETTKFAPSEKPAWLMHHYHKHHEDKEKVFNLYYWIYGRHCPMLWAKVLGQYYRLVDRLS